MASDIPSMVDHHVECTWRSILIESVNDLSNSIGAQRYDLFDSHVYLIEVSYQTFLTGIWPRKNSKLSCETVTTQATVLHHVRHHRGLLSQRPAPSRLSTHGFSSGTFPCPIAYESAEERNQANIFGTEQDRVNCSFYYKVIFSSAQDINLLTILPFFAIDRRLPPWRPLLA
jgi:hypothetical protein